MRPTVRPVGIFACYPLYLFPQFSRRRIRGLRKTRERIRHARLARGHKTSRIARMPLALPQAVAEKTILRDLTTPYSIKASFVYERYDASGSVQGTTKSSPREMRRRTAKLGDYEDYAYYANGPHAYSTNPTDPIPLRIQTVRAAMLSPIPQNFAIPERCEKPQ